MSAWEPIPPPADDDDDDMLDLTAAKDDQGTLTAEDLATIATMIQDALDARRGTELAELADTQSADPVHDFASHDDAAAHRLLEQLRATHRNGHPHADLAAIAAAVELAMRQVT